MSEFVIVAGSSRVSAVLLFHQIIITFVFPNGIEPTGRSRPLGQGETGYFIL